MTISELLRQSNIDKLDAEVLLAFVLEKTREFVIAHPEDQVSKIQDTRYKQLVERRAAGKPVAYLVGHKEFYGLDFLVNEHVLVPRPDSELMVELALKCITHNSDDITHVIDVGTGSGCIAVSVKKQDTHSKIQMFATDVSAEALAIAKKNAKQHGVDIAFFQGNLLEPLLSSSHAMSCPSTMSSLPDLSFLRRQESHESKGSEDQRDPRLRRDDNACKGESTCKGNSICKNNNVIITANLPYLTQHQFNTAPSIQHEPHVALVANDGGLGLYKELLEQIKAIKQFTLFMEIDPSQTESLTACIKKQFPNGNVEVHKDLARHERVVALHI